MIQHVRSPCRLLALRALRVFVAIAFLFAVGHCPSVADEEPTWSDAPSSLDDQPGLNLLIPPAPTASSQSSTQLGSTDEVLQWHLEWESPDPDEHQRRENAHSSRVVPWSLSTATGLAFPDPPIIYVETIRERHPNRQIKTERQVIRDEQGNYVNHGYWKMWDEQGELVGEGNYERGSRTGGWTRRHRRSDSPLFDTLPFSRATEPFISYASFQNDQLHGEWTIYDSSKRLLSRIAFSQGRRHGNAELRLPTGDVLQLVNFSDGALDGDVWERNEDGTLAKTATYERGAELDHQVVYFDQSQVRRSEGTYLSTTLVLKTPDDFWNARFAHYEPMDTNQRHGSWTAWYDTGQVMVRGVFRHGLPVGEFTWWYPSGQKYAHGQYVAGREQGMWRWWHRDGRRWTQGEFLAGEKVGQWLTWSETGDLEQQANYSGMQSPESLAGVNVERRLR